MTKGTPVPNPPASGIDWLKQQRQQSSHSVPIAPACNAEDAVDSKVEQFLQKYGVRYAPKTSIPIDIIDEKSSLANQARDVPIVPESVDRFAVSLRNGEYLPPVIVFPSGNRVTIVDGNNRYAAHKKVGARFAPGYVIDEATPSETIALLTVAANNDHGVTPDVRWRKRQAAHLVSVGHSAERACEAAGITVAALRDFQSLLRADARAKAMRIATGWLDMPETTRVAIGKMPTEPVFLQAARCAIDTGLDSKGAQLLLKEVKDLPTESAQVSHIMDVTKQRELENRAKQATGATNRVSSPKQSLVTAVGKLTNIDAQALAQQVLTKMDRDLLQTRLVAAGEAIIELQIALGDLKFGEDEEVLRARAS